MRAQIVAIAALVVLNAASDAGCRRVVSRERSVCLQLPTDEDNAEAARGIDWWGEPVRYECVSSSVRVFRSAQLRDAPFAYGWTDGSQIGWIQGHIYTVVRHEWGHVLGYGDSGDPGSAMWSAAVPEALTP